LAYLRLPVQQHWNVKAVQQISTSSIIALFQHRAQRFEVIVWSFLFAKAVEMFSILFIFPIELVLWCVMSIFGVLNMAFDHNVHRLIGLAVSTLSAAAKKLHSKEVS
jgi:hypothetical protein